MLEHSGTVENLPFPNQIVHWQRRLHEPMSQSDCTSGQRRMQERHRTRHSWKGSGVEAPGFDSTKW